MTTEELLVKLSPGTVKISQDGTPERHSKHSPVWSETEPEPHPNNEALSRLEKERKKVPISGQGSVSEMDHGEASVGLPAEREKDYFREHKRL